MLDWMFAALFAVAAIWGFRKGLLRSLIGLFGNILALLGSYVLAKPATLWLQGRFDLLQPLAGFVRRLLPMPEHFSSLGASFLGIGELHSYLEQSILPKSLQRHVLEVAQEQVNAVAAGVYSTMADIVAQTVAQSLLQGLVFIGLWFVLVIVLFCISHFFVTILHIVPGVGLVDRVGGMVVSLLLCTVTVLVLYRGISVLGVLEGSPLAQSQVLQFFGALLEPGTNV